MNEMHIAKITIDICDNNNNTISSINNIKLYIRKYQESYENKNKFCFTILSKCSDSIEQLYRAIRNYFFR